MKRYIFLLIGVFLLSINSYGEEEGFQPDSLWLLAYSKQDEFCQHMLRRLNDDVIDDGEIEPENYPEIKSVAWVSDVRIFDADGKKLLSDTSKESRVAIADVNNDGENEIAHIWQSKSYGNGNDGLMSFNYFDFSFKEDIYQNGIIFKDLLKNTIGDVFSLEHDLERRSSGSFSLLHFPIQNVIYFDTSGKKRDSYHEQYVSIYKGYTLYPLIYNNYFYILAAGSMFGSYDYDFDLNKKNLVVVRSYSADNNISDTCSFINYSI